MAKRGQTVRKPTARKRASTPKRATGDVDPKIEIANLRRDLTEALQQQTATADVLKIISRSTFDLQKVLNTLAETACRFCDAYDAVVLLREGELLTFSAHHGPIPVDLKKWPLSRAWISGRAVVDRKAVHVHDLQAEEVEFPDGSAMARRMGHRTILSVPLLREHEATGSLTIRRTEVRPFTAKQIKLAETFADQAVIAIENTRLFEEVQARTRDLAESLEQQTATSEVLRVISSSPGELQPVFDTMLQSAVRICEAKFGNLFLVDGDTAHWAAGVGTPPKLAQFFTQSSWFRPTPESHLDRVIRTKQVSYSADDTAEAVVGVAARLGGARSTLCVPMVKDDVLVGAIFIYRTEVRPFTSKQVGLLKDFADQAVIAIENTRLLTEQREALEQQTATAAVLQVINCSPGELAPVFEVMLEKATRLCGAGFGSLWIYEGEQFRAAAVHAVPPALAEFTREAVPVEASASLLDIVRGQNVVHVMDLAATELYRAGNPVRRAYVDLGGARTLLSVALRKDNALLGAFNIYRQEVRPFSDKQIALVQNFAAQAVIAMENARLITETREALEQQTATGDVLKIISRSSVDLEAVLDTLVETVARLCRADQAYMFRRRDDSNHMIAACGLSEEAKEFIRTHPAAANRSTMSGRVTLERRAVHIPDVLRDPEYTYLEGQKIAGFRTMLGIPLLREEVLLGIFVVTRTRVEPFTNKEIELVNTFADQAVIAIENARLFEELRDRQAELRITFDNMGDGVVMFDAAGRLTAWNRNFQEMLELSETFLVGRPSRAEYFRYLADRGEFVTADLEAQLGRTVDDTALEMRYERTRPDGRTLEVRRNPVPGGGFVLIYSDITKRKRAEEALRAARDAAETALRELQTAQDRLIQTEKLASLGQLTAGIAHEIKNPLNFVNNFSTLSVELVDEMNGMLEDASLDERKRKELDEIRELLKTNLEKVVQHGKRADSIVKNMLLHSRSGSGEHRPVDINAIIEESLNLAYHGARAEGQDFNITLERDFDPAVGVADIYPQEITRVLLNLISNGFYAATKRAAAANGFEPRLTAVTRNLGENVEICIRDNGMGIPPDIREKIFNPFFTTKPAGEGTGLGLSMSHDIVVKQHGGTIEVATEPGLFTEFIITLPRIMLAQEVGGHRS